MQPLGLSTCPFGQPVGQSVSETMTVPTFAHAPAAVVQLPGAVGMVSDTLVLPMVTVVATVCAPSRQNDPSAPVVSSAEMPSGPVAREAAPPHETDGAWAIPVMHAVL
jgi:hypothetical protein